MDKTASVGTGQQTVCVVPSSRPAVCKETVVRPRMARCRRAPGCRARWLLDHVPHHCASEGALMQAPHRATRHGQTAAPIDGEGKTVLRGRHSTDATALSRYRNVHHLTNNHVSAYHKTQALSAHGHDDRPSHTRRAPRSDQHTTDTTTMKWQTGTNDNPASHRQRTDEEKKNLMTSTHSPTDKKEKKRKKGNA